MKRLLWLLILLGGQSAFATTWYINQLGGTNTQCTGTTNAPYTGGSAQPCAYNHPFQMMDFNGNYVSLTTGDTVAFTDDPSVKHTYYMGEQNQGVGIDWHAQLGGICPAPNSGHAAGGSCILHTIPNGVTIIGQCAFAALTDGRTCHDSTHTEIAPATVLAGINGAFTILELQGTQDVTLKSLFLTQVDTCYGAGSSPGQGACGDNSNFVYNSGITFEAVAGQQGPTRYHFRDIECVGLPSCVQGQKSNLSSGDVSDAVDIYAYGNSGFGWNGDPGSCNNTCEGTGTQNFDHLNIQWNGCTAVLPWAGLIGGNGFTNCRGANTQGAGDGLVIIATNGIWNFTNSIFKYNTQDGLDSLHICDDVTTTPVINISTAWSEGNAGQQIKECVATTSTLYNSVLLQNCHITGASNAADIASLAKFNNPTNGTFTGVATGTSLVVSGLTGFVQINGLLNGPGVTPGTQVISQQSGTTGGIGTYTTSSATTANGTLTSGWQPLDYGDTCRAGGAATTFASNDAAQLIASGNTFVGYGGQMANIGCNAGGTLDQQCYSTGGATVIWHDNLMKGFPDPGNSNIPPDSFYFGEPITFANPFANVGSAISNDLYNTMRGNDCPSSLVPQETVFTCGDPLLTAETDVNAINPQILAGSPAIGAGVTISGISTDYNGNPRPAAGQTNPSIGAFEPLGAIGGLGVIFSGNVKLSGNVVIQ